MIVVYHFAVPFGWCSALFKECASDCACIYSPVGKCHDLQLLLGATVLFFFFSPSPVLCHGRTGLKTPCPILCDCSCAPMQKTHLASVVVSPLSVVRACTRVCLCKRFVNWPRLSMVRCCHQTTFLCCCAFSVDVCVLSPGLAEKKATHGASCVR